MTIPVLKTTLKCLTVNDQYALTPFWVMFSPADHASMTMPVLKTTVSATPILGPVVSGWSHFHDLTCFKNNKQQQVLHLHWAL